MAPIRWNNFTAKNQKTKDVDILPDKTTTEIRFNGHPNDQILHFISRWTVQVLLQNKSLTLVAAHFTSLGSNLLLF